jgi:Spy/CpxP family protein refolding chaperone
MFDRGQCIEPEEHRRIRMKKMVIALGVALVISLGGLYSYAQQAGHPPERRAIGFQERWGVDNGLNLTPEQESKFREMRRNFMKENAHLIGSLVGKRVELWALWSDPKAEEKAIVDKEKEAWALMGQLRDKRIEMRLAMRKILTPEQIGHWRPGWDMGHRGDRWGAAMGQGGMMGPPGMMGHPGMMWGRGMRHGFPPGPAEE